ncbi:MAG: stalk domain-containing protein [Oscillospiraceae bacterium]|nr:stalk domain-containing protein [Oscillospiraceae bacterium]
MTKFARMLILLVLLVLLVGSTSVVASNQNIRIRIDGEVLQIQYGQHPVVVRDRTLVPIRDVMGALGFAVDWNPVTRTAYLDKPGTAIVIPLGSYTMTVNDVPVFLDVASQARNGRTLVPIRAISEATGMEVNWFGASRIVDIQTAPTVTEPFDHHIPWHFSIHSEPDHMAPPITRFPPQTVRVVDNPPGGWARVATYRGTHWAYLRSDRFSHPMDWTFSIYSEPNFRAKRVATFGPQTVSVLEVNSDGWGLVSTYRGNHWVYLRSNRRFIERTTGLFEHRGAASHTASIPPQIVNILAVEGRWMQISTWLGPRWIHLDFTPPTGTLDALLSRHGNNISVYFENIETGFIYRYNPGRVYISASVTKAPFSMYLYQRADRGEINLDTRHRFLGGGTLTGREMLRRNLVYSCNNSTLTLRGVYGIEGYRRWVAALGGNPNWVGDRVMGSQLTVDETARFARAIYAYVESDAPHSNEFRRNLLNNQHRFIVSDHPVASKSGWTNTVFHDMAIVYADSPYILIILSARANHAVFREISMAFQRFNHAWF